MTNYFLTNNISGAWCGSFFANTDAWDALPGHLQELFRVCMDSSHYYRQHWYWGGEAHLRTKGKKLELTSIPDEEWQQVEDEALKFWERWPGPAQGGPGHRDLQGVQRDDGEGRPALPLFLSAAPPAKSEAAAPGPGPAGDPGRPGAAGSARGSAAARPEGIALPRIIVSYVRLIDRLNRVVGRLRCISCSS